jgi:hypothetical protein
MNYNHNNYAPVDTVNLLHSALLITSLVICLAHKRRRDADTAGKRVSKRQRNDADRARRRKDIPQELLQLQTSFFLRMFRMEKPQFLWLVDKITPILRATWTSKSKKMAIIGSGSEVSTFLLLAATIRWLAGGSIYDIAFMLKVSDKTIQAQKYPVMRAINKVLAGE